MRRRFFVQAVYLISCLTEFGRSLRLLELNVPTHKIVGESVKLTCRFDMEGAALYSVKWYRNEQEFYRFVPNDRPKLQIFPQEGIKVERTKSSRQHVTLDDLQIAATGTYRCEVSAEGPSFRTKHAEQAMIVVQPPKHNEIKGVQERYYVGDTANLTCFSRDSSPPASLIWKINEVQVYDIEVGDHDFQDKSVYERYSLRDGHRRNIELIRPQEPVVARTKSWLEKETLDTSVSNLLFTVDDTHRHFGLNVECVASIGPVYWHKTEETLTVSAREREIPIFGLATSKTGPVLLLLFCLLVVANTQ